MDAPLMNTAEHAAPQLIPFGELRTVPAPVPDLLTVKIRPPVPVNVSDFDCGLPPTVADIARFALRVPIACGEKVMAIAQPLFAGRVIPVQPSLKIAKSPKFAPPRPTAILVRGAFPL